MAHSANWVGVNPVSGGPENADQGNLISGNSDGGAGVWIDPTSFGNVVAGNLIGADAAGTVAIGDEWGVYIQGYSNLVGTTGQNGAADALERNVISGNSQIGVYITGSSATGNVVAGNYIGTTASGTAALGNASDGVRIESGADENWIGVNSVSGGPDNADQGNVISANGNDGVYIYAPCEGNVIAGDFIGTDASGQNALGNHNNGIGVGSSTSVYAQNNVIGIPGYGNVISGNISTDILVYYSVGTVIQANRIGTTADGMHVIQASGAIPVSYNDCVQIDDSPDTLVGGTVPGTGNLISMGPWSSSYLPYAGPLGGVLWGTNGVDVIDLSTSPGSAGTVIVGNLIGTDAAGTNVLGNPFFGVSLVDVTGVTVGGTTAGAANVIAGSSEAGIGFLSGNFGYADLGSSDNLIEGNLIGVNFDSNGNPIAGMGNGGAVFPDANQEAGIYINDPADPAQQSTGNTIGGTAAGARNIISGNFDSGVVLNGADVTGNLIEGNYIGTNLSGTLAIANTGDGVQILNGATNNTIGGTAAGSGNVISGNAGDGVDISGSGTSGNLVASNWIGTNATGTAVLANSGDGVDIFQASLDTVGGTAIGAGNLISGNTERHRDQRLDRHPRPGQPDRDRPDRNGCPGQFRGRRAGRPRLVRQHHRRGRRRGSQRHLGQRRRRAGHRRDDHGHARGGQPDRHRRQGHGRRGQSRRRASTSPAGRARPSAARRPWPQRDLREHRRRHRRGRRRDEHPDPGQLHRHRPDRDGAACQHRRRRDRRGRSRHHHRRQRAGRGQRDLGQHRRRVCRSPAAATPGRSILGNLIGTDVSAATGPGQRGLRRVRRVAPPASSIGGTATGTAISSRPTPWLASGSSLTRPAR